MAKEAESIGTGSGIPWRIIGWSIPAILLLLPMIAMRFTEEVNWTASDFVFAAILFGSVGLAFELIVRKSRSISYRLGAAMAVMMAFLTVWVNAAVGMIGSEDDPYNFLFLGVLLLALLGAIAGRLEPAGMMRAMALAAVAQLAAGAFGLTTDPLGATFSMGFAGGWMLAAALFWKAARDQSVAR